MDSVDLQASFKCVSQSLLTKWLEDVPDYRSADKDEVKVSVAGERAGLGASAVPRNTEQIRTEHKIKKRILQGSSTTPVSVSKKPKPVEKETEDKPSVSKRFSSVRGDFIAEAQARFEKKKGK